MRRRPVCPICKISRGKVKFKIDYDSPDVIDYLDSFYSKRQDAEEVVDKEIIDGEELIIRHCEKCNFYWHENILEDREMYDIYENWIIPKHSRNKRNSWERRRSKIEYASYIDGFFREKSPEDLRVLDFGMGWGAYLIAVRAFGCDVHGVEISDVRRKHAKKKGINTYKKISQVRGNFDVISAHQTIEHIRDPKKTLKNIRKLIKEDGLIHLTAPTVYSEPSKKTVLKKGPFQPLEHINGFTCESLVKVTEKLNLSPVHVTPSLRKSIKNGSVKKNAKNALRMLGVYRIYERLFGKGKPAFFTPN